MMDLTKQKPVNAFYGTTDAAEENADTSIVINPPASSPAPVVSAPVMPVFNPILPTVNTTPAPVETTITSTETSPRIGNETITQVTTPGTTTVKKETQINWGGIIKGAAIIGAVVVVGVVGWWAAGAIAHWALGSAAVSSLANTGVTVATPVLHGATYASHAAVGFIGHIPATVANFFSGLVGTGGAGLSAAHAATTVGAAHVLGGTAAVVATAPIAAHGLSDLHLFDHNSVLHTTPTVTTSTVTPGTEHTTTQTISSPTQEGGIFQNLFASKSAIAGTHASMIDGGAHTMSAEHAQDLGAHIGHHATHDEHADHASAAPDTAGSYDDNHKRRFNSWADRAASSSRPSPREGGFAANILANKSSAPAITSRGDSYTQASLDEQTAKLNAALAEPTR